MAIQILQTPAGFGNETPGPLNLPASFDRKAYAAKWVKEGPAVAAAAEREYIIGTQYTADGWLVWRDGKTPADGKPHTVHLQSGRHVLLFRDRTVQDAVNAICGNVGKARLSQERSGQTIGGQEPSDSGMLSDDRLAKTIGRDNLEEGDVRMNPVPGMEGTRVQKPALETAASRR